MGMWTVDIWTIWTICQALNNCVILFRCPILQSPFNWRHGNASDHKVWLCHAVWPYLQRCHLKNALKTKLNKGDPNYKCVIELERDPIRKHMIQTFLSFLPGAWYSTFHKHVFFFLCIF